MKKFPLTTKPGDVTSLLQKLPGVEVPAGQADAVYFKSLGFSISSSKQLVDILIMLGFLDDRGMPTPMWKAYAADEKRGLILASAIKCTYSELFDMMLCPYLEGDDTIAEIFKGDEPKASAREISLMVETFRNLSELADFQDLLCVEGTERPPSIEEIKAMPDVKIDPNLQLNIQIHIHPDTPEEKIEAIFKNMRKYLLVKGNHYSGDEA